MSWPPYHLNPEDKRMKTFAIVLLTISMMASMAVAKDKLDPQFSFRGDLDCTNAIPISCNTSVNNSTIGMPNNVSAYSCVGWDESGGELVYELVLDDEYVVNGSLAGMLEDLDIFFLDGCEEAACLAYGNTLFTAQVGPGTYYIVVDGYGGAEDLFALTVSCDLVADPAPPLAGGDTCDTAVDLQTAGAPAFSTNLADYTDVYESDCFSWHLPGGDAVYKIHLEAGELFSVTMDGPCDMAMYIMDDCASGVSLACSDNCCSGAQEVIDFTPTYTGTYYLVLDTFQAAGCEVIVNIAMPIANDEDSWSGVKALYR